MIFTEKPGENAMIECCVFDLDGTLLSTLETITYHLNNTLVPEGLSALSVTDTQAIIGDGARLLVERAVALSREVGEDTFERILTTYNQAYNSDPIPLTDYYQGIKELVDNLADAGVKLAVVTNKPEVTAKKLIGHFFPGKFDIVSGGRAGAVLKPDPAETLRVIAELGKTPAVTAFIGDTAVDIRTGKNVGAEISVGVSWGFRDRADLVAAGADVIVDTAEELLRVLGEK